MSSCRDGSSQSATAECVSGRDTFSDNISLYLLPGPDSGQPFVCGPQSSEGLL